MAATFVKVTESVEASRCPQCVKEKFIHEHVCVSAAGKLWFFSLRGVDLAKYSSYHKTALKGGYVSSFDLNKHEWDHVHFPEIDDAEHLDDFIFANYDTIFMLIYSKFGGMKFHKLLMWHLNKWVKVQFTVDQKADIDEDVKCDVQFSISDGILYIASTAEGRVTFSKMQITFEKHVVHAASILFLMSIDRLPAPAAHITKITVFENKIYAFWGCESCGFMWMPDKPIVVDLGTRKWTVAEVHTPHRPPQGFAGPSYCFSSHNKWVMMGGMIRQGMTGHRDCKEIWIFDLEKREFHKSAITLPENLTGSQLTTAYDPTKGIIYAADAEHCVYKASVEEL